MDYYNNADNEGELGFLFENITDEPVIINKGDKLGQAFFIPFYVTDDDNAEGIRDGGFGSTDK